MGFFKDILDHQRIEASAPCRIDMGGTLDLSTFFLPLRHLEPCTFNAALAMRTSVRLHPFEDGKLKITSKGFDDLVVPSATAPFDHALGLMLAVAAYFNADGVHIEIESTSPPRSALGGSSVAAVALIWAFAKALSQTGQAMPPKNDVALLAHAIEQSAAGAVCGIQDQLAAVFGGVNAWYWSTAAGRQAYRKVDLVPAQRVSEFEQCFLVAYCGRPHVSQDINGNWVRSFLAGRNREIWREIVACCRTFIDAIAAGRYEEARAMMDRETDLRCQMTPDVLDPMGKRLVQAARSQGCAARFTGAGGGGCIWALGAPEKIVGLKPVWQELADHHDSAAILETSIDMEGVL